MRRGLENCRLAKKIIQFVQSFKGRKSYNLDEHNGGMQFLCKHLLLLQKRQPLNWPKFNISFLLHLFIIAHHECIWNNNEFTSEFSKKEMLLYLCIRNHITQSCHIYILTLLIGKSLYDSWNLSNLILYQIVKLTNIL